MIRTPTGVPYGPCVPPSTWPLDHIPGTILDIIIKHLSRDAIKSHTCQKGSGCIFIPKRVGPIFTPMSSELATMSLVDHATRKVVLQKSILNTVVLNDAEHIASTLSSLRPSSLGYICLIMLSRTDSPRGSETANRLRKRIIDACPNLISIMDEDQEIAYMDHAFSPVVRALSLELKEGPLLRATPMPIKAPGLTKLSIAAPIDTIMSSHGNFESAHYPDKVKALCREITHLESLHLNPPGLCAPLGYERKYRLPQALFMRDMLPKILASVTILELALPQFCTVEKGSKYESHWYGCMQWLFETATKIEHLVIKMNWIEALVGPSPKDRSPRAVLDSMGLTSVHYDGARVPKSHLVQGDSGMSVDMRSFLSDMFQLRVGLKSISIRCDVSRPGHLSTPYRSLRLDVKEGPKRGQRQMDYVHHIDYEVVDAVIAASH